MYNKETQIVETASGTWLRFPAAFKKSSCLVELSNRITLNIDMRSGKLHVHEKDPNQVYQYVGEVFITTTDSQIHCTTLQAHKSERSEQMFTVMPHGGKVESRISAEKGETA